MPVLGSLAYFRERERGRERDRERERKRGREGERGREIFLATLRVAIIVVRRG